MQSIIFTIHCELVQYIPLSASTHTALLPLPPCACWSRFSPTKEDVEYVNHKGSLCKYFSSRGHGCVTSPQVNRDAAVANDIETVESFFSKVCAPGPADGERVCSGCVGDCSTTVTTFLRISFLVISATFPSVQRFQSPCACRSLVVCLGPVLRV